MVLTLAAVNAHTLRSEPAAVPSPVEEDAVPADSLSQRETLGMALAALVIFVAAGGGTGGEVCSTPFTS